MSNNLRRACLILSVLSLVIPASPGHSQLWDALSDKPRPHMSKPKISILCLPPSGTKPVPCPTAVAGSTLRLALEGSNDAAPGAIVFTEVVSGRKPKVARVTVSADSRASDGAYLITVPRHLCTKDKMGNYEIQHLMSQYNQAESAPRSIGTLTITC